MIAIQPWPGPQPRQVGGESSSAVAPERARPGRDRPLIGGVLSVLLAFLAASAAARDPAPAAPPFVCPETLADARARAQSLRAFILAANASPPRRALTEILELRRALLRANGCNRTLQQEEADRGKLARGVVLAQEWLALGADADLSLELSMSALTPFEDPRFADEPAVETYVRTTFRTPQPAGPARVMSDQVVSHEVFYCRTNRYALMENDYFRQARAVYRDRRSPEAKAGGRGLYAPTSPPAGSLNALVGDIVCHGP